MNTVPGKLKPGQEPAAMQDLDIQGFSYEDRHGFLPALVTAFTRCGGWVVDRQTLSAAATEFRVEIQLRSVVDLYGAMIGAGLELTKRGHLALTELCLCQKHLSHGGDPSQTVNIRLEVNFLEDITLHSLLASGSSNA